jgi:hypothetical protein
MQIGKSRTTEELSRLWEDQEWRFKRPHETLHREEFCSQVSRQFIWRRRPKNDENRRNWAQEEQPCAYSTCDAPRASTKLHQMRLGHVICTPRISNAGGANVILFVFVGLTSVFSPNTMRNLNCKYQPSSFRIFCSELWQFKRKATLELHESFYLLLDFLGNVFIFSNFVSYHV